MQEITQMNARKPTLIIPCYNEAERLPLDELTSAISMNDLHWVFVDDGSTDKTFEILSRVQLNFPSQVGLLKLGQNSGKAEAVRAGLNHALALGCQIVAFADADLATPISEIRRLLPIFLQSEMSVGMAARVQLLGTRIERKVMRHILGRIYATLASWLLDLRVYDTQCGFKMFRQNEALRSALKQPFTSRWSFDVELIGRLLKSGLTPEDFVELPLVMWKDVRGSKMGTISMLSAGLDLLRIGIRYRVG